MHVDLSICQRRACLKHTTYVYIRHALLLDPGNFMHQERRCSRHDTSASSSQSTLTSRGVSTVRGLHWVWQARPRRCTHVLYKYMLSLALAPLAAPAATRAAAGPADFPRRRASDQCFIGRGRQAQAYCIHEALVKWVDANEV